MLQVKQSVNEAQDSAWTLRNWRARMKRRRERTPMTERGRLLFLLRGIELKLVLVLVGAAEKAVAVAMLDMGGEYADASWKSS